MKASYEKKEQFHLIAKHVTNFAGFAPMFHSHCELIHVVSGKIQITVNGISHMLVEGETCIVFPYTIHQYENAPTAEVYIFLFDSSVTGAFEKILLTQEPTTPYLSVPKHIPVVYRRIITLYNQDSVLSTPSARSYLGAVVGEIISLLDLTEKENNTTDMTKQVLSYCSTHFADETISIQQVANALYISTSYVSKIFNKKLRYSFREYINILRINHAQKLLDGSQLKIIDIMLECGFKNQSSFNRVFYDVCQMTPKEYRQKKSI
jgi:AraC-like DNA-binding protein